MKILIVSDSHGLTQELEEIRKRHQDEVDAMIHCGDSELSSNTKELTGFAAVRGNCDYDLELPNDFLKVMADTMLYVTHGHLYNVKRSLMNLKYRAEEVGAQIVCFGHTHIAGAEVIEGILFINPGSIRLPRLRKEKTYAIVDVYDLQDDKQATVQFLKMDGSELKELSVKCKIG